MSKIKKYDCPVTQFGIEEGEESSESEANLNQLGMEEADLKQLFQEEEEE